MDAGVVNELIKHRTSVSCDNIPEVFLDTRIAKAHFSQFGKITRLILRPNRRHCTIEFERPEAAKQALLYGACFKDEQFNIYWTELKPSAIDDDDTRLAINRFDQGSFGTGEQKFEPNDSLRGISSTDIITTANRQESELVHQNIAQARVKLETLARQAANTSEKCYHVLEAKDHYIRLKAELTIDIQKARSIAGTCVDMCPEKERYLRDWKHMVPSYERLLSNSGSGNADQIDHSKAIKQYSRSSADQKLPLPHELRTPGTLGRTMRFLLTKIVDHIDVQDGGANASDWFHYIWDRTRAIRKDITQQDLCSPLVVQIVQQCTRFHIHCAARLVTEDPSVFDQKINTENMTKCLQTLKFMYTDLGQRGIRCPNEAEFRAYMVLLYLNDGSFLWEMRQLPENVIHSPEIKYALAVYNALDTNNYVRFFKLVRVTSYMNACILLRYFTQVRQKALNVLRKTYALRSTATLTLAYLSFLLGFENEEEALRFCEHYGVTVDRTRMTVLFEAKQAGFTYISEFPYPTERALQLVEKKRIGSVGEAICGEPPAAWGIQLSHFEVVSSFDTRGYFREELLQDVICSPSQNDKHIFKIPTPATTTVAQASRPQLPTTEQQQSGSSFCSEAAPSSGTPIQDHREKSSNRSHSSTPSTTLSENNIFGSIKSAWPSTFASVFSRGSNQLSAPFTDSTTTMAYASPPNDLSITPAGKKRTFFGAAKVPQASGTCFGTALEATSAWPRLPPPVSLWPMPSTAFSSNSDTVTTTFGTTTRDSFEQQRQPVANTISDRGNASSIDIPARNESSSFRSIVKPGEFSAWGFGQQAREETGSNSYDSMIMQNPQQNNLALDRQRREQVNQARLDEIRKREEKQRMSDAIEQSSAKELDGLLDSVVHEAVSEIYEAVLTHLQRYPSKLLTELENEIIHECVNLIGLEEIARVERRRAERGLQLMKKYWHRWLGATQRAKTKLRWRRQMESLPLMLNYSSFWTSTLPSYNEIRPYLNALSSSSREHNVHALLTDCAFRRKVLPFESFPENELIDLFSVLYDSAGHLVKPRFAPFYWKLIISVPDESNRGDDECPVGFSKFVDRWLQRCAFKRDSKREQPNHTYYYLEACNYRSLHVEQRTAICLRLVRGCDVRDETLDDGANACDRSNGILFVLHDHSSETKVMERLRCLLAKTTVPPPAVAFIHYVPNAEESSRSIHDPIALSRAIGLDAAGVSCKVFRWSQASKNDSLRTALVYLAGSYWKQQRLTAGDDNRLEMRSLREFLNCCIGSELWIRLAHSYPYLSGTSMSNGQDIFSTLTRNGNAVVQLYNKALAQTTDMLVNTKMSAHARLPAEFEQVRMQLLVGPTERGPLPEVYFPPDWDSPQRRERLKRLLHALKLHPLPDSLLGAIDQTALDVQIYGIETDGTMLRAELLLYLSMYPALRSDPSLDQMTQRLMQGILLQLAGHSFPDRTRSLAMSGEGDVRRQCYWVPLLELVSETLLRATISTANSDPGYMLPGEVCYLRDEFLRYTDMKWWIVQQVQEQLQDERNTNCHTFASESQPEGSNMTGKADPLEGTSTSGPKRLQKTSISTSVRRVPNYTPESFEELYQRGLECVTRAQQILEATKQQRDSQQPAKKLRNSFGETLPHEMEDPWDG